MFTLVTWIPINNGNIKLASIWESPGNLIIQNKSIRNERIIRVESERTERILGVRISATSQMRTKFEFILVQAHELAARIHP